jgi:hypothetical protein
MEFKMSRSERTAGIFPLDFAAILTEYSPIPLCYYFNKRFNETGTAAKSPTLIALCQRSCSAGPSTPAQAQATV